MNFYYLRGYGSLFMRIYECFFVHLFTFYQQYIFFFLSASILINICCLRYGLNSRNISYIFICYTILLYKLYCFVSISELHYFRNVCKKFQNQNFEHLLVAYLKILHHFFLFFIYKCCIISCAFFNYFNNPIKYLSI